MVRVDPQRTPLPLTRGEGGSCRSACPNLPSPRWGEGGPAKPGRMRGAALPSHARPQGPTAAPPNSPCILSPEFRQGGHPAQPSPNKRDHAMKSAVVVFPGLNRERDMIAALTKIGGTPPAVVWHKDAELPDVDLIVIPGGFSYGDYLRAGAIAAR